MKILSEKNIALMIIYEQKNILCADWVGPSIFL